MLIFYANVNNLFFFCVISTVYRLFWNFYFMKLKFLWRKDQRLLVNILIRVSMVKPHLRPLCLWSLGCLCLEAKPSYIGEQVLHWVSKCSQVTSWDAILNWWLRSRYIRFFHIYYNCIFVVLKEIWLVWPHFLPSFA